MPRWLLPLVSVIFIAGLLVACNDDDETDEPVAFPDQDPREAMVALVQARENQDFQAIYDMLVSDFHQLDAEGELSEVSLFRMFPGTNQVEDWIVEEHDTFVVVRDAVRYPVASVFRPEGDEWRFDPGHPPLMLAYHEDVLGGDGTPYLSASEDYDAGWEQIDGPEGGAALLDRPWVLTIVRGSDHVYVTIDFGAGPSRDYNAVDEVIFPLERIFWSNGDDEGDVDVTWTRAIVDDESKRMVGWPRDASEQAQIMSYRTTFRLVDAAGDADKVTLHFGDVQVLADDPEAQFTMRGFATFAPETSHEVFDNQDD